MTTFLTNFNRFFAFVTAALIAALLVATVATLTRVPATGAQGQTTPIVAQMAPSHGTTAAARTTAVEKG